MKRVVIAALLTLACHGLYRAQASGNIGYSQSGGNARAEQNERNKRVLAKEDTPPSGACAACVVHREQSDLYE